MISNQRMFRYIFILAFSALVVSVSSPVFAQADSTDTDTAGHLKKKDLAGHQLCIGADIFHPILGQFQTDRYGYEIAADYYLHNEFYAVAEGGWGGSKVDYPDMKYTTTNNYLRVGFNKSVLPRDRPNDWDMMLIGMRLAVTNVRKSSSSLYVIDSVWGNTPTVTEPGKNFMAYWAEVTGGMRVEIVHGLIAGWNIRGKFLLNGKSFKDFAPLYIAGFGKGDKNAVFDFNVYLSYGIRWQRKNTLPVKPNK
jgi:Domain of unknown function (DUF6048)